MLKITPQSLVQFNPLDEPIEFDLLDLPSKWTGEWVSRRWVDGLKALQLIPIRARLAVLPMHGLHMLTSLKT
jgi:hypothetical protein